MIKFVLNRGLSRPLFYSRVPAMEHLRIVLISVKNMRRRTENKRTQDVENDVFLECCHFSKGIFEQKNTAEEQKGYSKFFRGSLP